MRDRSQKLVSEFVECRSDTIFNAQQFVHGRDSCEAFSRRFRARLDEDLHQGKSSLLID